MVEIGADGNIATFSCSIAKYEYISSLNLISAAEAYKQVLDGNFEQYNPFESGNVLTVTGYSLDYEPDTKGFYRPIYRFEEWDRAFS